MAKEKKRIGSLFIYSKSLGLEGDDHIAIIATEAQWENKMGSAALNIGDTAHFGTVNIIDTKNNGKMVAVTLDADDAPFKSAVLHKYSNDEDGSTYFAGSAYTLEETTAIDAMREDREAQNELRNSAGTRMTARVGSYDEDLAPFGEVVRKPKKENDASLAPAKP